MLAHKNIDVKNDNDVETAKNIAETCDLIVVFVDDNFFNRRMHLQQIKKLDFKIAGKSIDVGYVSYPSYEAAFGLKEFKGKEFKPLADLRVLKDKLTQLKAKPEENAAKIEECEKEIEKISKSIIFFMDNNIPEKQSGLEASVPLREEIGFKGIAILHSDDKFSDSDLLSFKEVENNKIVPKGDYTKYKLQPALAAILETIRPDIVLEEIVIEPEKTKSQKKTKQRPPNLFPPQASVNDNKDKPPPSSNKDKVPK